jgi:hypothetical protein
MIETRKAAAQDIPELARVHVRADWDTERRWRQVLRDGDELLVAVADDATVGFGHGHEDRTRALYLLAHITGRAWADQISASYSALCTSEASPRHGLTLWQ